ncbi:MAG: hypothetical protein JNJ77_04025 [Planctomycetia bacterium]|nr:hypothetical protein [Planctomycetia bacterium]
MDLGKGYPMQFPIDIIMVFFQLFIVAEKLDENRLAGLFSRDVAVRRGVYHFAKQSLVGLKRKESMLLIKLALYSDGFSNKPGKLPSSDDDYYSPRRIALAIVSDWHESELIEPLINLIDSTRGAGDTDAPLHEQYPAIKGLINIGTPALKPCLREIADIHYQEPFLTEKISRDARKSSHLLYVVWGILGYDESLKLFAKEISRIETDNPKGADNLKTAVERFKNNALFKYKK